MAMRSRDRSRYDEGHEQQRLDAEALAAKRACAALLEALRREHDVDDVFASTIDPRRQP
jgi:hypothetical protein